MYVSKEELMELSNRVKTSSENKDLIKTKDKQKTNKNKTKLQTKTKQSKNHYGSGQS